ncbi:Vms1/Ankzf1 family peptidyl-tRNA hydrolase [Streptomyces sp. B1866]|uniref:baeRF2 domain-containing protein n=1 Tax=Streptomyces sp. B1866 TaxID=3075431 RepID=UPI00288E5E86|nr:Vms1/Ankzf1 family peptidyl-tRNA hydrolase [Streptomyces sp. B1866]MDT3397912.1 Vms1/Ankzf1 family peptidyl-tRNA hydrolase [Streptomyces sp. B1866]
MYLGFLNPLFDRPGPWASVYFGTARTDQAAAGEQELAARDACRRLAGRGADQDTCQAVYDELHGLPRAGEPFGRAVFATHGRVVLDPPLTMPPPRAEVSWGALPHAAPLLDLADDTPSCLVAYIDRQGADFELRDARRSRPAGQVHAESWPVHRTTTADWSERHFQLKTENVWDRNAAAIADALAARHEELGTDVVVLAGDARERRAVRERLPSTVRTVAVESAHGGRAPGADRGARLLDGEVQEARAARARRHTEEVLERFRAGRVPAGGRAGAAEGVPALVEAAREHRIDALLVWPEGPDVHRQVWVGAEPDQLAVRRGDVRYLGDPRPVPAEAEDALIRSAAATGAEVLAVHPGPGRETRDAPAGGLGAVLRWP